MNRTVSVNGGSEKLLGRIVYGELLGSPENSNHRGQVYRVYDGAAVATSLGSRPPKSASSSRRRRRRKRVDARHQFRPTVA